jgi:stress-induced morphogen
MSVWDKRKTPETRKVEEVLRTRFPKADAYRYNSASIRVRIIDKAFRGKSRTEREDMVFPLIGTLPEDTQADIMILLMLAPEEKGESLMNLEFEDSSSSKL